jgi:uncharacterized Zn finger protein
MQKKYNAGQDIESYCTRCKLNRDHTIIAMDGADIIKVRCKNCGSTHKFKNPSDAPKVRLPRRKKLDSADATAEIIWEAGMAAAKGEEHVYSMAVKYHVGDIVIHHTFGKGIVLKLYVNKCEMLFKDRERLMASAN